MADKIGILSGETVLYNDLKSKLNNLDTKCSTDINAIINSLNALNNLVIPGLNNRVTELENKCQDIITADQLNENLQQFAKQIQANISKASTQTLYRVFAGSEHLLEYIENPNHAQFFLPQSRMRANGELQFEAEVSMPTSGTIASIISAYTNKNIDGRQGFMVFNTKSHKIDYYWPGVPYTTLNVIPEINFAEKFIVTQNANGIEIRQGSFVQTQLYNGSTDPVAGSPLIQILGTENPSHTTYTNARLHSLRIYEGNELNYVLLPAMNTNDPNMIGLYDCIGQGLLEAVGQLVAGPKIIY